jgi:hypothetical protein
MQLPRHPPRSYFLPSRRISARQRALNQKASCRNPGIFLHTGCASFDPGEPERYRKDVPKAEVHVLDAGHFALDTAADQIAQLVRDFIK